MQRLTTTCALALFAPAASALSLQVTSQQITLSYPHSIQEVFQPADFGTISRQGEYVDTLIGGEGGSGTFRIAGSASATTSWDGVTLSWSDSTSLNCDILAPFSLDEYSELSQQSRARIELRFSVTNPIALIATRSPSLFGTNSGPDTSSNFSIPSVRALDPNGDIIPDSGFLISSLSGELQTLNPGSYVALLTTQSLFLSGIFGSPPSAGQAIAIDGASLQVVPTPVTLACFTTLNVFAIRRRR